MQGVPMPMQPMKNPGVATVLSFLITGLGQMYNGQIGKGLILIGIQVINALLMFLFIGFVTYPIVWLYGVIDANKSAQRINAQMASLGSGAIRDRLNEGA
jgi:TM2 domain-containing membrane protein YozV